MNSFLPSERAPRAASHQEPSTLPSPITAHAGHTPKAIICYGIINHKHQTNREVKVLPKTSRHILPLVSNNANRSSFLAWGQHRHTAPLTHGRHVIRLFKQDMHRFLPNIRTISLHLDGIPMISKSTALYQRNISFQLRELHCFSIGCLISRRTHHLIHGAIFLRGIL